MPRAPLPLHVSPALQAARLEPMWQASELWVLSSACLGGSRTRCAESCEGAQVAYEASGAHWAAPSGLRPHPPC